MQSYAPPLLGSTTPRLYSRPLVEGPPGPCGCGCALSPETSRGFSAINFAEGMIGLRLIPWQRWLLIHALELRTDPRDRTVALTPHRFRFRTLLILVARQNGKTSIVEIKNLWKLFVLRVLLVIGTAQTLEYAEESWDKAVEIVEAIPELEAEVKHVDKTNGKKTLRLHGGPRWKVATASRRGGRSLSGDDVNLDELREHQNWDAWGAVTKTTMARPDPQVWAFSNAGDDKSIVLNDLLATGRALVEADHPGDESFGLMEWSAPDDVKCTCGRPDGQHRDDCRLQDRDAWAQANPSLGYTVTEEAIASALATDPVAVFRTEVLCQRVENLLEEWQVIPEAEWRAAASPWQQEYDSPASVCIEMSLDRHSVAIAVATVRRDGKRQVVIAELELGPDKVVPLIVAWKKTRKICAIVIDRGGPAGSLVPDLEAKKIEVEQPSLRDLAGACGALHDGIAGPVKDDEDPAEVRNIRHADQAALTVAIANLRGRKSKSEVWEREGDGYIAVGAALALWGHAKNAPKDYDPLDNIW